MQAISIEEVETAIDKYGDVVLTKNSKNNIIMMSIEEYKNKKRNEAIEKKLLEAEQQIERGETIDASVVFKELEEKYEF